MKRLYFGILFVTSFLCVSTSRVKRYSGSEQRGDWNWNRHDQLPNAQTKSSTQVNWPSKGSGGSTKGRVDSNTNRDSWSSGENRNDGFDMTWNTDPQGNNKGSAYPDDDGNEEGNLETILGGIPGMDFPNFASVPNTDFDCSLMPSRGYYGDVEAGCQVFHICQPGNRKDSFLCPVGTIFNQKYFVCDWWFNVNCSDTPSYYDLNNEVYKETTPVTEEVPVTTEKTSPWNPQDLDRKKPTKSWGNQPSTGKQNPRWKDTPTRRGSKSSDSVTTSRDVSNSWSRSDVQKEITVSWGTSNGATSGTFGSSSTSSNSFIPTTKPIWYGIDGQPAKDQSNGMSKRTGFMQTSAPFGARMGKNTATVTPRISTEEYEPTTPPLKGSSYGTSTTNVWHKNSEVYNPSTTKGWLKDEDISDHKYPPTNEWLKEEDIPETSINPTGVKGVWEQQTRKRIDQNDQTDSNGVGHKGLVTKSNQLGRNERRLRTVSNKNKKWDFRQTFRNLQSSDVSNKGWVKNDSFEKQNISENFNSNAISRRKNWK